jgi:hypothetical protein
MHYAGTHVVGDWADGRLYALDLDCYDDDGDPLVALRAARTLPAPAYNEIRYNRLRIDMEAGVGLVDGPGRGPGAHAALVQRRRAHVGRRSKPQHGPLGEYARRVTVDRLGMARDRVFEVSISDPVKRVIMGAAVDAVDTGR